MITPPNGGARRGPIQLELNVCIASMLQLMLINNNECNRCERVAGCHDGYRPGVCGLMNPTNAVLRTFSAVC